MNGEHKTMQNIYEYIYQNMNINELRELIQNKSIFFVPISSTLNMTDIIPGKFVGISEIYWIDSTNLFQKYSFNQRFILEPYYSQQKKIFGVSPQKEGCGGGGGGEPKAICDEPLNKHITTSFASLRYCFPSCFVVGVFALGNTSSVS